MLCLGLVVLWLITVVIGICVLVFVSGMPKCEKLACDVDTPGARACSDMLGSDVLIVNAWFEGTLSLRKP